MFQAAAAAVNDGLMVEVLDSVRVLGYLSGYFDRLAKTGSVSPATLTGFLRYLFLVDFVGTMYGFFTESDYTEVETLLSGLFSAGDCLLPYPVFCSRSLQVGKTGAATTGNLRVMEDSVRLRVTEDENLRGV